jgi:hypothetical protein
MAKSAKKLPSEDEIAEQGDTADSASDEQENAASPESTSDEQPDGDAVTEQAEVLPEVAAEPETPFAPLHPRLEKAVRTMSHSGNPDAAHALNKLELLVGTLKLSLPAAINSIEDEKLKADLQSLLAIL